jgi:3-dehydroquinate synthetase
VEDWLQRANLPLFLSQVLPNKDSFAVDEVLSAMRGDKKYSSTGLRWVIPTKLPNQALGTVAIRSDVPEAQIRQALAQIGIAE